MTGGAETNNLLAISLEPYMTLSGAHCAFRVGEELSFALAFSSSTPLEPQKRGRRGLTHLGGAMYSALGRSRYSDLGYWVDDFGVPALQKFRGEAPKCKSGKLLAGTIHLAMDSGDYDYDFSLYPNSPPLVFDWRIERIELLEAQTNTLRELMRVPSSLDSADDECVIYCTRLSEQPRH